MTYRNRPPTFPLHPSFRALDNQSFGLAVDGQTLEACVSDPVTPANNYLGPMAAKFAYASPSSKMVWNRHGLLVSGTTLRCDHDPGTLDASAAQLNSLPGLKVIPITGATIYAVGQTVVVSNAGNINQWMAGEVVNWNAGTKSVTLDVYAASGLFSGANWKVIVARGVRVEPQSANLWTNSNVVGGTGWTLTSAAASPAAALAPDGSQTMSELFNGGSNMNGRVNGPVATLVAGAVYVASVYVAQGSALGASRVGVFNSGFGVSYGVVSITWPGGAPELSFPAGVNAHASYAGRVAGKDIYRIEWSFTVPAGQTTGRLVVYPDREAPFTGSIFAWGAQLEVGGVVSSLIPTVGAQVSRGADAIGVPLSAFPYNGGAGQMQVNGDAISPTIVSGQLRLPQGHIKSMRWVPSP